MASSGCRTAYAVSTAGKLCCQRCAIFALGKRFAVDIDLLRKNAIESEAKHKQLTSRDRLSSRHLSMNKTWLIAPRGRRGKPEQMIISYGGS